MSILSVPIEREREREREREFFPIRGKINDIFDIALEASYLVDTKPTPRVSIFDTNKVWGITTLHNVYIQKGAPTFGQPPP